MRDFFKTLLENLYVLTGSRQMEFISSEQLPLLLDSLESICRKYSYIPEETQKSEINKQILEDQDFTALTPKILHKWLFRISGAHWKESAHTDKQKVYDQEPCKPEIADKYIKEWRESLAKIGNPETNHQSIKDRYPEYFKQKFIVEGIEIMAGSLDEAREIYLELNS